MEVFKLLGKIAVDNAEANRAIDDTSGKAENSKNRITSAFKKIGAAVVTYLTIDKIKDFGQACVDMSAEVAAEQSAFEQIMGDYSDAAQGKVNEIADATGMVSTRLTPYMTSMTAKFKGLGFDIGDATDYAKQGLNIAADAAAFWDKSLDDSMSALNSFVNGSYEGGEAIGLFANDTQMAAYAVKEGIVSESKEWANLDEKIKQATRLEYAENMQKASGAVGQAAKESNQYANVQSNLTEKWRQFKAQVGEPILQNIVLPGMKKLGDFITGKLQPGFDKLKKKISDNKDKITELKDKVKLVTDRFKAAGESIASFVDWLTGGSKEAETLQSVILGLITGLLAFNTINGIIDTGKDIVDKYRKAMELLNASSPLGWVVAGISAVIALEASMRNMASNPMDEITEEFAALSKEEQAVIDKTGELSKSYDSLESSWKSNSDRITTEYDNYDTLAEKLDTIVDKNGKVKEGHESEAESITGQLSDALGIEIEMRDGIISKYGELKENIKETIDLKKAEAFLDANKSNYIDAQTKLKEATDNLAAAESDLIETNSRLYSAESFLDDLYQRRPEVMDALSQRGEDYSEVLMDQEAKVAGLKDKQKELQENYDKCGESVSNLGTTVNNYDELSDAVMKGNVEKINDSLELAQENFITAQSGSKAVLEQQVKDYEKEYENMRKAVERGSDLITEEDLKSKKDLYELAKAELEKKGIMEEQKAKENTEKYAKGIKSKKSSVQKASSDVSKSAVESADKEMRSMSKVANIQTSEMCNTVRNHRQKMEDSAKYVAEGAAVGIASGADSAVQSVGSLASRIVNKFRSVMGIQSPSKVMKEIGRYVTQGLAVGITDEESSVKKSAEHTAFTAVNAFNSGLLKMDSINIERKSHDDFHETLIRQKSTTLSNSAHSESDIIFKLNELIEAIKSLKIYLDGDALVGEIAPAMDARLGSINRIKRRGG